MRTQAQVLDASLAKLPPGWAWPVARGSVMGQVLTPLAAEAVRFEAAAEAQLAEVDPGAAGPLLEDYERVLGPDPCRGPALGSPDERRRSAAARWTARGGASRAYFTALAAGLGHAVTVREFRPAYAGEARAGDPCNGEPWAFAWQVAAPPLAPEQAALLECTIRRRAPAHTVLSFAYPGASRYARLGEFVLGYNTLAP